MCGIAGFLRGDERDPAAIIEQQLQELKFRGPDSVGWHLADTAVIGQTRLAVIDLATGDPPITNEDHTVGVALNGEIYNYRMLREQLSDRGHRLRTKVDTEVIAHLAEELDPEELASSLDGMFAFAVWDERKKRLALGRDRLGKKPLYYWSAGDLFVFASEIKSLLLHPDVPRSLDPAAIPMYLTYGFIPTPHTFFEGIRSVPPGHVLVVDRGRPPRLTEYWRPLFAGSDAVSEVDASEEEMAAQTGTLLRSAVEKRMIADVPLGAFLSGGIDSSVVVALMAQASQRPIKTFTIGFNDSEGFDERGYAREVANHVGSDHTEYVVEPASIDLIERLVWHYDQPFGDSSAIPTFLLSELTRRDVTVALSGDGGDELFAGYERFAAALQLDRYRRTPQALRRLLRGAADLLPPGAFRGRAGSAQRFLERGDAGLPDAFMSWASCIAEDRRHDVWGESLDWTTETYRRLWASTEGADLLDRLMHLNLRLYLLDDLLPKVDRMSMAHALEVRSPFLDHHLVEYALRLPRHARIKGLSLKRVLKGFASGFLPEQIVHRRKRGFGVPLDRWFRTNLEAYVKGMLASDSARIRSHLVPDAVDRLLVEHGDGRRNHGYALWSLLTLEVFLRREGW